MKLLAFALLSALLLCAHSVPRKELFKASAKDLNGAIIRVPAGDRGSIEDCWRRLMAWFFGGRGDDAFDDNGDATDVDDGDGDAPGFDDGDGDVPGFDDGDGDAPGFDDGDGDVPDFDDSDGDAPGFDDDDSDVTAVDDDDFDDDEDGNEDEVPTTRPPRATRTRPMKTTTTATTTSTTDSLDPTEADSPTGSNGPPRGNGDPPVGTGSCESCSVDNFDMVNQYRQSNGLNTVGWSNKLAGLADQWSKTMYDTKVFEHSDFPYWENIIFASGMYTWDNVAERFFEGWRNSAGHDRNMKVPTHECMGVGIYGDGRTFYGTQIFSNDCP